MRTHRYIAAIVALGLVACGGSAASVAPLPQTNNPGLALTQASITVVVPALSPSSVTPRYISANTQSLTITVTNIGGSPVIFPAITANISAQAPGCSPQGGGLFCTIIAHVPVGNDTFAITLYSQPNATGSPLASGVASAQAVANTVTQIPLALGGIVASVAVNASVAHPIAGIAQSIPLTITAFDASGATIIPPGNYTNPIALIDNDTSGSTALSTTSITAPGSPITLVYNGSLRLAEAIISATALGLTPSSIRSASIVPVGQSGSNALAVFTNTTGNVYAYVPTATGLSSVLVATPGGLASSTRQRLSIPAPIGISPAPSACTINAPDSLLACISFTSPVITNFQINNNGSLTQLPSVTTDAPLSGVSNSGGTCVICGIEYDDADDAYIIATGNGYEVYTSPTEPVYNQHGWTIFGNVAENFGYNPVTNTIMSPVYATIDATGLTYINVTGKKAYVTSSQPMGLFEPDAGAFDSSTNIAAITEEIANQVPANTNYLFLENMSSAQLNVPSTGLFTTTQASVLLSSSLFGRASSTTCDSAVTGIAIDPASHLGFVSSEFCGQSNGSPDGSVTPVGVIALPTSSLAPLSISRQIYLNMPPLPDGTLWNDAGDPHAVAAMQIQGLCSPCGITYNAESTWLAIIDMNALLTAPRSSIDPNLALIPQSPPYGNVVTYVKAQ